MILVPLADIVIGQRQRRDIAPGPLDDLANSILQTGLLHPPVCWPSPDGKWHLTVGERRFRAIEALNARKPQPKFQCGNVTVDPGSIPITPLSEYVDNIARFEAELHENVFRQDLSWQDKARALSDLHTMRQVANPAQTLTDTGAELASQGAATSVAGGAHQVRAAQIIAANLDNEKIANARNQKEALSLIYKAQEEAALAAIARRKIAAMPKSNTQQVEIRNADLKDLLPQLPSGVYDLVLADPPYGIDANSAGFRSRSVQHHNYKDTAEEARDIARQILTEGFRVCKPRANILMFCAIEYFDLLKLLSSNMGWVPFSRPLIWQKSDSEGLAPWGSQGPRITTEFIFYATKGQRGLTASPTDVFRVNRVGRSERVHAAEKPVELQRRLIECSTLPGDHILDPCCGSGSSLIAARELKRFALGIEKDPDYYNTAMASVFGNDNGDS